MILTKEEKLVKLEIVIKVRYNAYKMGFNSFGFNKNSWCSNPNLYYANFLSKWFYQKYLRSNYV